MGLCFFQFDIGRAGVVCVPLRQDHVSPPAGYRVSLPGFCCCCLPPSLLYLLLLLLLLPLRPSGQRLSKSRTEGSISFFKGFQSKSILSSCLIIHGTHDNLTRQTSQRERKVFLYMKCYLWRRLRLMPRLYFYVRHILIENHHHFCQNLIMES